MREILFRGKRCDNGKWVKGFYACLYDDKGNISYRIYTGYAETDCGDFYPEWFEVDPSTVGQYTGLTDKKNDKRIFEGDILRISERGYITADGVVIFENGYPGGWLLTSLARVSKCSLAMRTDVEIIGNIHDDPGLLGGDK